MFQSFGNMLFRLLLCCVCLGAFASAADQDVIAGSVSSRKGYSKGELMPVSCMNRSAETGEHIPDSHGGLQYIPFPICNETGQPLAFPFGVPQTQTCTIDVPDELYHIIEFFVHNDVPLTCRLPTYPLSSSNTHVIKNIQQPGQTSEAEIWTPFTIALQGLLQQSHLHLHTGINVLFHTASDETPGSKQQQQETARLIASTAYSVPNTTASAPREGIKVVRYESMALTFNIGWIDGDVLPGMVGRPVLGVRDHSIGFSLLSFFAVAASAGVGAMAMLVYERRKSGRTVYANGLLGGNVGSTGAVRSTGYGGYGGYNSIGKRD